MSIMEPKEIASRARALRLSRKELARKADVSAETVSKILREKQRPNRVTRNSLTRVLVDEEQRLLAHLLELHPIAEPAGQVRP